MAIDLRRLFVSTDPVEWFLCDRLFDGGVWKSWRTSDGIVSTQRLVSEPSRLSLWGEIYEVEDQSRNLFWVDVVQRRAEQLSWSLHYDVVVAGASRRDRPVIRAGDRPEAFEWRAKLVGKAKLVAGELQVEPGATRVTLFTETAAPLESEPPLPDGYRRRRRQRRR